MGGCCRAATPAHTRSSDCTCCSRLRSRCGSGNGCALSALVHGCLCLLRTIICRHCCATAQHGTTPDALALACVMRQPFAPMVLSGAASVAQLRSNSAALALAQSLPDDAVVQLQAALVMAPHKYWDERAQLAWN